MSKIFVMLASIFVFGAVGGWVIELFFRRFVSKKKWMNPGLLTGPYLPIYGLGTLFLFLLSYNNLLSFSDNIYIELVLMFLISSIFMTLMELVGGLFFLKYYNLRLWNYEDRRFNYKGVICLSFSLIWGFSSLIYYYLINPYLTKLLVFYSDNIYLSFFVGIIFGFMILDTWETLQVTSRIKKFANEAQTIIHYDDFKELTVKARAAFEQRKRFFVIPHKELVKERIEELFKNGLIK